MDWLKIARFEKNFDDDEAENEWSSLVPKMVFLLSNNEVNKQLTCGRKEIITMAEQKTEKKEEFLSILQVICLHPAD